MRMMNGCLTPALRFLLLWTVTSQLVSLRAQMVKYSTDCKDPDLLSPDHVTCQNERFQISCGGAEVVVGTVCLGTGAECNHTAEHCLDEYLVTRDNTFRSELEQCLWTQSHCDIPVSQETLSQVHPDNCVKPILGQYDYIGAFDVQCISGNIVFDICDVTTNLATLPDTGYIHSPGFPSGVYDARDCSHAFHSLNRSRVEFWIQRVQLEDTAGDHVTITGLSEDGSPDRSLSWTGHDVYSLEIFIINSTYGFMVEYKQTVMLDGFLISYTVSDPPPTSPPVTMTTGCTEEALCISSNLGSNFWTVALAVLMNWWFHIANKSGYV